MVLLMLDSWPDRRKKYITSFALPSKRSIRIITPLVRSLFSSAIISAAILKRICGVPQSIFLPLTAKLLPPAQCGVMSYAVFLCCRHTKARAMAGRSWISYEQLLWKKYNTITLDASLPALSMYRSRGYREVAYTRLLVDGGDYLCYWTMELKKTPKRIHLLPKILLYL